MKLISEFALKVCHAARGLDRKKYKPHWRKWHSPFTISTGEKICFICLAGAWVASELKDPKTNYDPFTFPPQIKGFSPSGMYMEALECIRKSGWTRAAEFIQADKIPYLSTDWNLGPSIHNSFEGWEQFDSFLDHVESQAMELKKLGF